MKNYFTSLVLLSLISFSSIHAQLPAFTNVGGASNLNLGGAKDGGAAWGDFNNDGCLDVLVNTADNGRRTRLYMSNCVLPNPTFTDVTATHASGLLNQTCERSVIWADFTNDGNIDFARNRHNRIELWINKGPGATPPYKFGTGATGNNPDNSWTTITDGMNSEGLGWIDIDGDGWLDLVIENHNFGIDIMRNPADGTANFVHVSTNAMGNLGLPAVATDGDYMTIGDYDNDGLLDILARKRGQFDLWHNNGVAAFPNIFTVNNTINQDANNSNKGGVLFSDFDMDGDFDIFWSDRGTVANQIHLHNGFLTRDFSTATGEPAASSGVTPTVDGIDGCAAGDIDMNGTPDLFLSDNAGASYLYLNNTPPGGALNFTRNNLGINVNANGEGVNLVDYDNDGDLDVYVNVRSGNNQLWQNDLNPTAFLKVELLRCLNGGVFRHDIGAQITLSDSVGNVIGGIQDVNSSKGHGSQNPPVVVFGLPYGCKTYQVDVTFTNMNGLVETFTYWLNPCTQPNNTITINSVNGPNGANCPPAVLPVDFIGFEGHYAEPGVALNWQTRNEVNNSHFEIERSKDGVNFEVIGQVDAQESAVAVYKYSFEDVDPIVGNNYYRLHQFDVEGSSAFSNVIKVATPIAEDFAIYPNPAGQNDQMKVSFTVSEEMSGRIMIFNSVGQLVREMPLDIRSGLNNFDIPIEGLSEGMYMATLKAPGLVRTEKIIIRN